MKHATPIKPALVQMNEACEILGIAFETLQRAIAAGQIKTIQAPGTTSRSGRRVVVRTIDEYIDQQLQTDYGAESSGEGEAA